MFRLTTHRGNENGLKEAYFSLTKRNMQTVLIVRLIILGYLGEGSSKVSP